MAMEERRLEDDREGSEGAECGVADEKKVFGDKDGEEFDQVKVALVPVVKLHVPDELDVSGHIVVSDHAAVPPAELHSDASSDEVMKMRGRDRVRMKVVVGRITGDPSGWRGLRW